jgi:hypothetical protein
MPIMSPLRPTTLRIKPPLYERLEALSQKWDISVPKIVLLAVQRVIGEFEANGLHLAGTSPSEPRNKKPDVKQKTA